MTSALFLNLGGKQDTMNEQRAKSILLNGVSVFGAELLRPLTAKEQELKQIYLRLWKKQ